MEIGGQVKFATTILLLLFVLPLQCLDCNTIVSFEFEMSSGCIEYCNHWSEQNYTAINNINIVIDDFLHVEAIQAQLVRYFFSALSLV